MRISNSFFVIINQFLVHSYAHPNRIVATLFHSQCALYIHLARQTPNLPTLLRIEGFRSVI
nr:MAG TPA: hypothetical protein [Caudoviricetes sp.]